MIFPIMASHLDIFKHIVWDSLSWISGSNKFSFMFLILFSVDFSCVYGQAPFYE